MNALGMILSILAILAFGAAVALEKQTGIERLRRTYLGHLYANRNIRNHFVSEQYAALKTAPTTSEKEHEKKEGKEPQEITPPPLINQECARINLFPLIEKGAQKEPMLYELCIKLFKKFYGPSLFAKKEGAAAIFLDTLLEKIRAERGTKREAEAVALEKVSFVEQDLQEIYYKMLKGTKGKSGTYPSLLDYVKIEPKPSKICLFHAHPNVLSLLFSSQAADTLYAALHAPKAPQATREMINRICTEASAPLLNEELFELLDFNRHPHEKTKKEIVMGEDLETEIFLRAKIL